MVIKFPVDCFNSLGKYSKGASVDNDRFKSQIVLSFPNASLVKIFNRLTILILSLDIL